MTDFKLNESFFIYPLTAINGLWTDCYQCKDFQFMIIRRQNNYNKNNWKKKQQKYVAIVKDLRLWLLDAKLTSSFSPM